jgi:hypothetical protein
MSRPLAFSLALLLTLIASQHVSAAGSIPTLKHRKPPSASSATVKVATTKASKQYSGPPEQPYGVYEVPEAIADAPEYNTKYKDTLDRRSGEQQHEEPQDSYGKPEFEPKQYEPKQSYGEPESKAYEPAPHDEGYEAPKVAYNPAPCPKAMTADAVEDGECCVGKPLMAGGIKHHPLPLHVLCQQLRTSTAHRFHVLTK